MIDSKTVPGSRWLVIGHELQPVFEEMQDLHNERAFIPVQKYANVSNVHEGEIGSIGYFRLVVNPEMLKYEGAGAASTDPDYYTTGGNLDVFPMVCVGDESFTTIGFQTDGKTVKFKIWHKPPGKEIADRQDPFGETGFMSIKWYYGFMLLRPERLAVVYSAGKL